LETEIFEIDEVLLDSIAIKLDTEFSNYHDS